jgi:hypothetical protein
LLSHGHFLGHDNFYRNMYVVMEVRVWRATIVLIQIQN